MHIDKAMNQKPKFYKNVNRWTKFPAITVILSLLILSAGTSFFLTACGRTAEHYTSSDRRSPDVSFPDNADPELSFPVHPASDPDTPPGELPASNLPFTDSPAQNTGRRDVSPFHSVPYFHDDTGKCIQSLDGYLYGYWNGQLCRYDSESLGQSCYFCADSNQSGKFCIYEDNIFFLERPLTAYLTGTDTCLYMTGLDRQNRKLLTSQVPNNTAEYSSYNNYDDYYEIDIYNDIIYLISHNFQENIYYRLDEKFNSVTRIEKSETLYGLLPEGYKEPIWYSHLPSLPYQMRHYGYLFLMDDDGNLAAYDVESGRLESINFPTENISRYSVFLTNNALYCAEETDSGQPLTTWYRISLDDFHRVEEWGQFFPMQRYTGDDIFYDESGAYFAKREGSVVSLYQIPWDGSGITLLYSRYLKGGEDFLSPAYGNRYLCHTDGTYFYFNDKEDSGYRELSYEEILEKIASDQYGVLKQYYISGKQPGDEWLCLEDSKDIWIRQHCEQDGASCWNYYRFPCVGEGYITALDACVQTEEYFFLHWKDTDYLVTVNRDKRGGITGISTHCLLADSVYNGWILRQTLTENGEITVQCLNYWI